MALTEAVEEYLEKLYWFGEAGIEPTQANLARAMNVSQPSVNGMVKRLVDDNLVERDARRRLLFTVHGEDVARHIVSRHRLIEAFLVQVFGISWDEVHEEAHTFEHAISPNLEKRMYALLKDATACPHGHPIGDAPREPGELLATIPTGSSVRVLRLENEDPGLLRLFKRTGVEPGDVIEVAAIEGDSLVLSTPRQGDQRVPLEAAQSVSVRVERRGAGPAAAVSDLDAAVMLSGTAWGM